jgi:hypothetical protein
MAPEPPPSLDDVAKEAFARRPAPFARSKATCEWLAWLVHQKSVMLSPLDRIRRDLATRGIKLAMSCLVTQIERAADLLSAVDGEHWKQLLAGSWRRHHEPLPMSTALS